MSLKYYKLSIPLFILFYFISCQTRFPVFPFGPIRLACLHDGGLLSWDEFGLVGWIFLGPNVVCCNHAWVLISWSDDMAWTMRPIRNMRNFGLISQPIWIYEMGLWGFIRVSNGQSVGPIAWTGYWSVNKLDRRKNP